MDNRLKRFLSLALAIIMVIGMMPANVVFATGNEGTPDAGQDSAQVEPTTEEPTEPEETTVHICAYDTVVIDKEATAREAGQKTLSCVCGASKTEKICADDCQLTAGHEGDCVLACDKNPGCIEDENHDGPCVSEEGALLIGSAEELEAAMAAITNRNAVTFNLGGDLTTDLKLTADITLNSTLVVPAGYDITVDLAGYTMSAAGKYALHNKGTLTINDTKRTVDNNTVNGKIHVTSGDFPALYNEGTATVKSGVFVSAQSYALDNRQGATLNVEGGSASGINNFEGTVNISGGTHYNKADLGHVLRNQNGEMYITGGSFTNDNPATETVLVESGKVQISGEATLFTIKAVAAAETEKTTSPLFDIKPLAAGKNTSVTINGGKFEGGFRIGDSTSLTINGGYFHDIHKSAYTVNGGTVNIYGGNFQDTNAQTFAAQNLRDGFIVRSNGNEVVKNGDVLSPVVAKIRYENDEGDYGYASLAEAVEKAYAGATIRMCLDDTVQNTIPVNKNLTIEVGTRKITSNVSNGYIFELTNGCKAFTLKNGVFVSNSGTDLGVIDINAAASVVVEGGTYGDANNAFTTNSGAIFKGQFVGTNEYASIKLSDVSVTTNHYVFYNKDAAMDKVEVEDGTYTSTAYGAFVVDVINTVSFQDATIIGNLLGVAVQGRHATQKATATFTNDTIKITNPNGSADIGNLKNFVIAVSSNVNATVNSGSYGDKDKTGEQIGLLPDSSGNSLLIKNGTFDGTVSAPGAAGAVEIELGNFTSFNVAPQNTDKLTVTMAGGTFDADPTNYLLPTLEWIPINSDSADKGKVKVKDVQVTNTDAAPVQGVTDRTKVQDILDEIKYSYALRDTTPSNIPNGGTLEIALSKLTVNSSLVPTEIVYDVDVVGVPVNNNVTFYLPVPSAVTAGHVKVYHEQDLLGVFPVETSSPSGEKYVQVISSKFSDYTLIPVAYEAGVTKVYIGTNGYKTLEAALLAAKGANLEEIVVEIVGDEVEFSKEAESFKKITFNGIDGNQVIDMMFGGNGAAFDTKAEIEFNYLTIKRPDPEPAGRRDHHFYVRGGLTYNYCKLYGLFNVSVQDTTFNHCEFWNNGNNNSMANNYVLWLYNSKDVVVNVIDCDFNVTNRAIKMYAYDMAGNMTLNISGTDFVAEQGQNSKTVVEMTFENCDGNAVMLLNIDENTCTKKNFGAPEHIAALKDVFNSWFNSEIRGTDTAKGAVVTIDGSVVYNDCEAKIGNQYYTTLQKAINAVKNGETIYLIKDTNADVTIKQEAGKSFTIDGSLTGFESSGLKKNVQAVFSGTMFLQGDSRHEGAETLTIQNIKFATDKTTHDFISCDKTDSVNRYAHNVTVKGCTFECTNNAATNAVVGMRYRQCYNMTVEDCTAKNLFLLMWATGGNVLTVKNCKSADNTVLHEGGVNVGTTTGAVFEDCNFKGKDYGIRADGSAATTLTIKNSNLTADIPVYVRNVTAENYTLVMEGANTLTPTGSKTGIVLNKAATITGEYDAGEQPTVRAIVELNGETKLNNAALTSSDMKGIVQSSGKRHFTIATEAAIGKVYYDYLVTQNNITGAITAAINGDTIDLLCDIETASMINFSNKAITVNGKPDETAPTYAIKAKADKYWTADRYLVQSTGDITLENIIIDGNNVGCRGIQLNYSGKNAVVLENVTAKNITADKNSCDYAIMSNVPVLTIKGQLKFDGCKYGRLVLGDSRASVATVASGATLTNVKVNLEKIDVKTQKGSELIVAKNAKYDVQTHVKGHHVEYEDGKYKLKIDNTVVLDNAFAMQDTNRSRIYIELLDAYVGNTANPAESKITVKLYTADNQLISTTTNIKGSDADLPCVEDVLGVNIVLGGEENSASSSWNTVFEKGHPRADMPASYYKLFLNDSEDPYTDAQFADGKVPVLYTGIADQNPVDWEDLKYINRVINENFKESPEKTTLKTYLTVSDAVAEAQENDTLKLLGNVTETGLITIDKSIKLDLNGKELTRAGAADQALMQVNGVGGENPKTVTLDIINGSDNEGIIEMTTGGTAIKVGTNGVLKLSDVTVTGADVGVALYKNATVTVNSGEISGKDAVRIYGGVLNVEGGEVTGTDNAIITISDVEGNPNIGEAVVNISGGKITGKIELDNTKGIPDVYGAEVTITGGEFLNSNLDEDYIRDNLDSTWIKVSSTENTTTIFDKEVPITMCKDGYFCEKIANSDPVRYQVIENRFAKIDMSQVADGKIAAGEKKAYVDGVAYDVEDNLVILLNEAEAKKPYMFITTYGYETKDNEDTIDDYPNAMHVWLAEGKDKQGDVYTSYTVERFELLDNFFMYNGTSIRIGGSDTGIRFISSVDVDDVRSLMDGELIEQGILDGATLTEMGTEFWKTNRARSQVYGGTLGKQFNIYKTVDGRNRFTGMLVNLSANKEVVGEPFFSRPYAEMKFGDENNEKTITLYGGTLERSIYYVAQQVDASGSFHGTSYDSYVKNLIKMGEEYHKEQAENDNSDGSEGGTNGSESANTPNS